MFRLRWTVLTVGIAAACAQGCAQEVGTAVDQAMVISIGPPHAASAAETARAETVELSADEQYFLCLVNRARHSPGAEARRLGIDLNEGVDAGTITPDPKQPLVADAALIWAARRHSDWMRANSKVTHGVNGNTPEARMRAAGYRFVAPWGNGENLGFTGTTGPAKSAVDAVDEIADGLFVDKGVRGRGHRTNLLKPEFRETGVGIVQGTVIMDGKHFHSWLITQDFAYTQSERPQAYVTGVVFVDTVKADAFYTPGEGKPDVQIVAKDARGKEFTASTSRSGGYALQLPPGQYTLMADGGEECGVTIGNENVGVDFILKQ